MLWIIATLFVLLGAGSACLGGLVGSLYEDALQLLHHRRQAAKSSYPITR